jgi:hypothetical protein
LLVEKIAEQKVVEGKKTKRRQKNSEKEVSVLIEETQKNLVVIQSKFSSAVTNSKKDELWGKITEE